MLFHTSHEC
jgi:hypothetical protein